MPSTAQVFRSSLPSVTFSRFGDFGAQDIFSCRLFFSWRPNSKQRVDKSTARQSWSQGDLCPDSPRHGDHLLTQLEFVCSSVCSIPNYKVQV